MEKLSEKRDALSYFAEYSRIPHGSGNMIAAGDFCRRFAAENRLDFFKDDHGNVLIRKPASCGAEGLSPVILQGHLDMVAVQDAESSMDMEHEGITLVREGDILRADGTSLGADNGIAVGMMLSVLADKEAVHPPLEAVFTVDEEIGLLGALAFDKSCLQGKRYINLDAEGEGHFTVSCAGGATAEITLPVCREMQKGRVCRVVIDGLSGGHSGTEIDKGHENALSLAAELLSSLSDRIPYTLLAFSGGEKDNAIPTSVSFALVSSDPHVKEELLLLLAALRERLAEKEPSLITATVEEDGEDGDASLALTDEATRVFRKLLLALPNGVRAMSGEIAGLVQTSANLAIAELSSDRARVTVSVRSSVREEKEALLSEIAAAVRAAGGECAVHGAYPAWEYRAHSPLRDCACAVFRRLSGKEPIIEAIHAGLECGVFYDAIADLDCIAFGPQLENIHTPREWLSISSAQRTEAFLRALLAELAKGEKSI